MLAPFTVSLAELVVPGQAAGRVNGPFNLASTSDLNMYQSARSRAEYRLIPTSIFHGQLPSRDLSVKEASHDIDDQSNDDCPKEIRECCVHQRNPTYWFGS